MKCSSFRFAAVALACLLTPALSWGLGQTTCESPVTKTFTVFDTDGYTTPNDVNHDGWEPHPLLYSAFYVDDIDGVPETCVVATFSSHSAHAFGFGDADVAYQVRLDGQAMYGHTTFCSSNGTFFPCIVMNNNTDPSAPIAGHSYHFVQSVTPGWHRIEVYYTGCCNGGGAYVGGSILTVQHE